MHYHFQLNINSFESTMMVLFIDFCGIKDFMKRKGLELHHLTLYSWKRLLCADVYRA